MNIPLWASCGVKREDGSFHFKENLFHMKCETPLCFYGFVHFGAYSFTICTGVYL